MKIKFNILKLGIIFTITALILAGCEDDFLERSKKIRRTLNDVQHQGFGNLKALGMAPYTYLRGWTDLGNNAMLAAGSDEADFANNEALVQRFNDGGWTQFTNPDEVMTNYYRGIRATFEFLHNSTGYELFLINDTFTTNAKAQYIKDCDQIYKLRAENHFLRAWFYFELMKRYGEVAILDTAVEVDATIIPPRSPVDTVVKYILNELDIAYPDLIDTWVNYGIPAGGGIGSGRGMIGGSSDVASMGRAEKVAAKALRLRVLLYAASPLFNPNGDNNKWLAAAAAGHDFLTDPAMIYWRYLWGNYAHLFNGGAGGTKLEELLTSRRGKNSGVIFTTPAWYAAKTFEQWNYPIGISGGGTNITAPSQNLVDAFEMKTTGLPIYSAGSGYDSLAPYANRDPRLGFIVGVNGDIYGKYVGGADRPIQSYTGGPDAIGVKTGATTTGYYLKKMARTDFDLGAATSTTKSFILMRYAEVLLNYAEAMNEAYATPDDKPSINGTPALYSAREAVNLVRARTGVAMPALPAGLTKDEFRIRLRNERRVELAFEEHRFFDVRRWKIAETTENMPLMGMRVDQVTPTTYTYTKFVVEPRIFDPAKMYLYPIPNTQVIINNWQQNPGW